ncbi:uncharacterized protein C4orf54 homolog [Sorex araneus]|uniref:uncharacterized protein C4orf54 homolog n=1 Tax=Sorex araneus TaxID=42254 RepID=UPI0024334632|nr:uncharacterized protein C4orf54 homolog [Sorex araneus]
MSSLSEVDLGVRGRTPPPRDPHMLSLCSRASQNPSPDAPLAAAADHRCPRCPDGPGSLATLPAGASAPQPPTPLASPLGLARTGWQLAPAPRLSCREVLGAARGLVPARGALLRATLRALPGQEGPRLGAHTHLRLLLQLEPRRGILLAAAVPDPCSPAGGVESREPGPQLLPELPAASPGEAESVELCAAAQPGPQGMELPQEDAGDKPGRPRCVSCSSCSSSSPGPSRDDLPGTGEAAAATATLGTSSSSLGFETDGGDGAGGCQPPGGGGGRRQSPELPVLLAKAQGRRDPPRAGPGGAHYITTHEIQLSEVEQDTDFDVGLASRWDFEDNNVIYSLVDYASFGGSDESSGTLTEEDEEGSCYVSTTPSSNPARSPSAPSSGHSTEVEGGPPPGAPTPAPGQPRQAWPEPPRAAPGPGPRSCGHQILLSIKPRGAINEPSAAPARQLPRDAGRHAGDMSLRLAAERGPGCPHKPGRLQTASGALRAWELADRSGGASSGLSELDDADQEVRSLTSRAFRSLAYPCFEALHVSSRESTLSDAGFGRWSTLLDLKCAAVGARVEQSLRRSSAAAVASGLRKGSGPGPAEQLQVQARRAQSRALEFVVSKVDGEIKHVDSPRRAQAQPGPRERSDSKASSAASESGQPAPQKKSRFASSLLQNVISKTMQREHEFRMERGEARDPGARAPPPEALQRQSSRHSEAGSEGAAGGAAEAADGAASAKSPVFRASAPRESGPGPAEDSGEGARAGADAARGALPRSQHSAFRAWREPEAERGQEPAPGGTPRPPAGPDPGEPPAAKPTLRSRLFVPNIQRTPRDARPGPPATSTAVVRPKAPEIKIRLGSVQQPAGADFSIAQLLTPRLAGADGAPPRGAAARGADGPDKVPQFRVRDVRDRARAQGPLHPVRDVRKLLKGPADGDKAGGTPEQGPSPRPRPEPPSPVVVTCQAPAGRREDAERGARAGSPEGTVLVHRASGRLPVATIAPNKAEQGPFLPVLRIVSTAPGGARGEGRGALQRLTAAVRSMDELCGLPRHAWKRRSDPLPALAGSHVLSLIAREEQAGAGPAEGPRRRNSNPGPDGASPRAAAPDGQGRERPRSLCLPPAPQDPPRRGAVAGKFPQGSPPDGPSTPPGAARPLKASPAARGPPEGLPGRQGGGDCESCLVIPPKRRDGPPTSSATALCSLPPLSARAQGPAAPRAAPADAASRPAWRSKPAREKAAPEQPPAAAFPGAPLAQPSVLCFSPPGLPAPGPADPFPPPRAPQTQRKVLLDVTTGQYYLVDTPVQPATRRLFDPETGQYVDVPMPVPAQQPAVAPVSLPVALSPGAYAPTYMIYPGFLPTVLPPAALQQAPRSAGPGESPGKETTYFLGSGQAPASPPSPAPAAAQLLGAGGFSPVQAEPVISITSQPLGPRIVAPPSFDGTTMSFVVEHR